MKLMRQGFPAHAGIDLRLHKTHMRDPRLPRARGDRPLPLSGPEGLLKASPRTRGSTHGCLKDGMERAGFPAHAGIDPLIASI